MQSLARAVSLRGKQTIADTSDSAEREAESVAARVVGARSDRKSSAGLVQKTDHLERFPFGLSNPANVPGIVEQALQSAGHPLDRATRAFFESRMGQNFAHVRLHTDGKAADSARSIHAQAYTLGSDIAFAEGRYSPHTDEGKRLLAHELVHTLQQPSRAYFQIQRSPDLGDLSIHVVNGKTFANIKGANVHIDQTGVSGPKSIDLVTDSNGDTVGISLEEGNYTVTVTFWCCDMKVANMHVDGNTLNFLTMEMKNCDCRISSQDGDNGSAVASSDFTANNADGSSSS
jgi:hypothetical protein